MADVEEEHNSWLDNLMESIGANTAKYLGQHEASASRLEESMQERPAPLENPTLTEATVNAGKTVPFLTKQAVTGVVELGKQVVDKPVETATAVGSAVKEAIVDPESIPIVAALWSRLNLPRFDGSKVNDTRTMEEIRQVQKPLDDWVELKKEQYGGWDKFKATLANAPEAILTDLGTAFGVSDAAKITISKAIPNMSASDLANALLPQPSPVLATVAAGTSPITAQTSSAFGIPDTRVTTMTGGAATVARDAPIGTFTTAKGSTYEHFADATTTRNRAARNDNEVAGPQPRSGKTIFMSKEAVNDWGPIFQNTEIPVQLIPLEGNKAKLVHLKDYGPKKAGDDASGTFEFTTTPQLGLHPVEIVGSTNTNRRNIHFGNEIVSIGSDIEKQTAAAFGGAATATKLDNLFENMGEEGALAEFSSIGENINSYIMNVDNKALLNALSDPNMEAYRDVLQANLSEAFPTGKIKVTRIEGYADPSAKKTKKDFVVDAKDVFFVGNVDEKELIVRNRATGKPMSVRIQDDQSFSKVDKPKKEPVLEPVSTAASAYFPQKTTTAAVKQSVWEQAQMRPIKGFENITVDQLEKYKELISDPDMEIGDVADYIRSINTNPDFDLNDESTFEILDSLVYDKGIVNKPTEYTFRSPIPDIANTVTIPQDGIRGADFLKELDRNPDVRNSEVAALDLEIEPTKRYTREELVAITNAHTYDTKAVIKRGANAKYESTQRQVGRTGILDDTIQEVEYAEITINATRDENVKAGFKLEAGSHFGQQNMAHSRVSIVEDIFTRERSVLVEEVQTDMIQHGYIKPSPPVSKSQFRQDRKKEALRNIEELLIVDYAMRPNKPLNVDNRGFKPRQKEMFSDLLDYLAEVADTPRKGISPKEYSEKMKELSATYLEAFDVPTANTGVILGAPSDAAWATYPEPDLNGIAERLIKKPRTEWDADDRSIYRRLVMDIDVRISPVHSFVKDYEVVGKGVGSPPIKKIDEATRLSLLSAMSYAADNGVSKIIIPNIERIVQKRFTPGSKQYDEAIKPGSGFHNTYVKSVDKFIKELQSNFGENSISVSKIELPYKKPPANRTKHNPHLSPRINTIPSNEATVIDFSALIEQGYDLTKPRFAKGGVVNTTEKQMNNLFAEGGIQDDGMNVDPVSGNEVPSGSMATEVRDDIDAKLSEGEYVVPADVVRYFGVAFFEKIRQKAKEGLAAMESGGRIGGEAVSAVEEDLLPFDVADLQSVEAPIEAAEGGYIGAYAPGGDVEPLGSTFNPQDWMSPGSSVFDAPSSTTPKPNAPTTSKTYVNDAGQTILVMFDASGQPMPPYNPIPTGYYEGTTPKTTPNNGGNNDNGSGGTGSGGTGSGGTGGVKGLTGLTDTDGNALFTAENSGSSSTFDTALSSLSDTFTDQRKYGKMATGLGALLGGPITLIGGIANIGFQVDNLAKMQGTITAGLQTGAYTKEQAAIKQKELDTLIDGLSLPVDLLTSGSKFGSKYAAQYVADIAALKPEVKAPEALRQPTQAQKDAGFAKTKSFIASTTDKDAKASSNISAARDKADKSDNGSPMKGGPTKEERTATNVDRGAGGASTNESAKEAKDAVEKSGNFSGTGYGGGGGRAKGGLMMKKKK